MRPHLEFAAPAWSPSTVEEKEKLENVQKKAVAMVSGLKGRTYEEKLRELDLQSLEDRRADMDMVQVYKIMNRVDNVRRETWFTTTAESSLRETRASSDPTHLDIKRTRTELRRQFFSMRVVEKWNALPRETRESRTLSQFKKSQRDCWKLAALVN